MSQYESKPMAKEEISELESKLPNFDEIRKIVHSLAKQQQNLDGKK